MGCGDKYSRSDFPACSLICAAEILARMENEAVIRGWDLRDYLPQDQRPDEVPWDAWQAATKLHGKNQWRKIRTG